MKACLAAGANINAVTKGGWTVLMCAVDNGQLACLMECLKAGADVDAAMDDGDTALMLAAEKGHLACLTACIDAGADVNAMTNNGRYSPLLLATARGDVDAMRQLLRNGASMTLRGQALENRLKTIYSLFIDDDDAARRNARGAALIESIHAAGGWNRHVQGPWFALVKLRKLGIEGKATFEPTHDPSILAAARLCGIRAKDSDPKNVFIDPVPPEIFRHIAEYWWWG